MQLVSCKLYHIMRVLWWDCIAGIASYGSFRANFIEGLHYWDCIVRFFCAVEISGVLLFNSGGDFCYIPGPPIQLALKGNFSNWKRKRQCKNGPGGGINQGAELVAPKRGATLSTARPTRDAAALHRRPTKPGGGVLKSTILVYRTIQYNNDLRLSSFLQHFIL